MINNSFFLSVSGKLKILFSDDIIVSSASPVSELHFSLIRNKREIAVSISNGSRVAFLHERNLIHCRVPFKLPMYIYIYIHIRPNIHFIHLNTSTKRYKYPFEEKKNLSPTDITLKLTLNTIYAISPFLDTQNLHHTFIHF